VNIMHAKTLMIGDEHIGYLYVQITGNQHQEALNYLESKGIEVSLYV
ncbi:MAG TPA: methionine ABC transporter ATP-binding protein, partial [Acholeplasmataceae bacterium]|nr:methionine ABC transporter ATP-binding protein [Acholeplasmataceae bacterium]